MGEVKVELELANYVDQIKAEEGLLPTGQVRHFAVQALVDSGAVMNLK